MLTKAKYQSLTDLSLYQMKEKTWILNEYFKHTTWCVFTNCSNKGLMLYIDFSIKIKYNFYLSSYFYRLLNFPILLWILKRILILRSFLRSHRGQHSSFYVTEMFSWFPWLPISLVVDSINIEQSCKLRMSDDEEGGEVRP